MIRPNASGADGAAWFRGTRQLRARWRSWLGLALLVGLVGGIVVAAAAGARRTTTAYDRLLASSRPFDVILGVGCTDDLPEDECASFAEDSVEEILTLPTVADGVLALNFLVPILKEDGFSIQPQEEVLGGSGEPPGETCYTGSGEVDVLGSPSGRLGNQLNRHRFVAGRAADPTRADEVVLSVATARRAGVTLGDTLRIVPAGACDGPDPEEWPEPFEVTVVGLHVTPGEVQPQTGPYLQSVTVTPPLLDDLAEILGRDQFSAVVRLRGDATVEDLTQELEAAGIPATVIIEQDEFTRSVRQGLRPDALTLWLLAALGAAASAVVLLQAVSRQAWASAEELPALRAIGFTSRDLARVGMVEGAAVAVVSGLTTAVLAVAASSLFPIARARVAEPDPGVRIDAIAVGLGAMVVAVGALAAVALTTRWVAARTTSPRPPTPRLGRAARALARLGAPPAVIVGVRTALEPGHAARSVPVRSGLAGAAVGMAALVGAFTFNAGLDHLLHTPRLVGWNWDVGFLGGLEPADPEADPTAQADELLARATSLDGVERVGYATFFPSSDVQIFGGQPAVLVISISSGPNSISPTVTSGRAPVGPDEILVTRAVLADLGRQVGDAVEVRGGAQTDSGETRPITATVTIVGTGVFPLGDGSFEQTVSLTFDGLRRLMPDTEPQFVVADLAPGADRSRTLDALSEIGLLGPVDSHDLNVPALVDLDVSRADDLPRLLGSLMAVLAAGVLAHLVFSGVHARRHELATLRALGFTGRQVRTALACQATAVTIVPFAIAAVIGTVAGRTVWFIYAERLGVAPEAVVAWRPLAAVLGTFIVIANVVAAAAGYAVRHRAAADLRTE